MRKVLITGGSRGIGAECVREFTKCGYNVCFTYNKSVGDAMSLAEETGAMPVFCDVTDYGSIKDMFCETGSIDILINNAGISEIKMFQDITESDWDDMFNVNIKGMFLVTQLVVGSMIRNKWGRIINISSMWGETGASCEVHYSASKAAVTGFTKALAKELAPSGITVNSVAPGAVKTDMNSHLTAEEIEALCEETPVMRMGECTEIVHAIKYLADENAGFTTGTVLSVNGGIIM